MLNNYSVSFRNQNKFATMNIMARNSSEAYCFVRQLYNTCIIYAVIEYLVKEDGTVDVKKTPIREPRYFENLAAA